MMAERVDMSRVTGAALRGAMGRRRGREGDWGGG